jgi:hypothetical protein
MKKLSRMNFGAASLVMKAHQRSFEDTGSALSNVRQALLSSGLDSFNVLSRIFPRKVVPAER